MDKEYAATLGSGRLKAGRFPLEDRSESCFSSGSGTDLLDSSQLFVY